MLTSLTFIVHEYDHDQVRYNRLWYHLLYDMELCIESI